MKKAALRRVETKIDNGPSVYVLVYHDLVTPEVVLIHGAFATENKVFAELKRLGKMKENKLSRKQKLANTRAMRAKQPRPHKDPMDGYSIREISVR